ncbi:MAG: MFS transporter [Acidobacteria bacterium]|nr:MFS transporter [Acidobacteriota bacterium]
MKEALKVRLLSKEYYKWLLVSLLFFVAALNYGDRTALTALFPLLRKDLGMSDVALAAVGTSFLWSYGLVSPLAGYLGDRFPRSALITWSLVAWSLVTALTGLVHTSQQLLGMRVLLGLAEALYIPASAALIADFHPTQSRARANSIHLTGVFSGVVAGSTVAGYIGDRYGWRFSTLVLGGAGFVVAVVCYFLLYDKPRRIPGSAGERESDVPALPPWKAVASVLRVPCYLFLAGQVMLVSFGSWIFSNWMPLFFAERFNMGLAGAGFSATFALQAGSVLGILGGGLISDRIARRHLKRRMLMQACCNLLSAPFLLAFVWTDSFSAITVSIFLFSLVKALGGANENPVLCDVLNARQRATAIGISNLTSSLMGGLGILIAGCLKSIFGLSAVFAGISAIVVLSGLLLLVGYRFFLEKDLQRQSLAVAAELA